jgi:hypothetical protein
MLTDGGFHDGEAHTADGLDHAGGDLDHPREALKAA